MKTITLLNSKGGTGKTTFAVHIAAGLALAGKRVLVIDADSQGNATTALALPKRPHLYDLVVRNADWQQCITRVASEVYTPDGAPNNGGSLWCVSGNIETMHINGMNTLNDNLIARRLAEVRDYFDFVIFDTSPTASKVHSLVHNATDWLLLPTQLEGHSALEGLPESVQRANDHRERGAREGVNVSEVVGILPNMYRKNTATHQQVLEHLKSTYGALVWPPVALRIAIAESNLARQLVYAYAPDSVATKEITRITNRVQKMAEGHKA